MTVHSSIDHEYIFIRSTKVKCTQEVQKGLQQDDMVELVLVLMQISRY